VLSEDFPALLVGLRAGAVVAGYRLEEQVGVGGMAVVFRARDERLGRRVALKILAPARAPRPDHVYLSDFGVSKGAVSSVSLAGAGQFLGTPDYSAPEQIRGLPVDAWPG
jgi:serine/threonine protein kinase